MITIIIGITVTSIYVASLTSDIMDSRVIPTTDLTGSRVGVIKGMLGDMLVATQHGGILQEIESTNTIKAIQGRSNIQRILGRVPLIDFACNN